MSKILDKYISKRIESLKQIFVTIITRGSKLDGGGAGCRLSMAQSGKSRNIFCADEMLAANMNSSTIEFVSKTFLASTSIGSAVSLSTLNLLKNKIQKIRHTYLIENL